MQRSRKSLVLTQAFGLVLFACLVVPAFGRGGDEYQKGDEVIVDIYGDGREVCNGIVKEVYRYSSGTFYSVIWDCGDGYSPSNTGSVPASRLRPRGNTKTPALKDNANPVSSRDARRQPAAVRDNDDADVTTEVSAGDLDFFVGQWKLSRYGGGSNVERDGKIYRETLLYIAKAAPIVIKADGTYSWTVRDGSVVRGKWRKLRPEEDNITNGKNGLVLLKGFDDVDWRVYLTSVEAGKETIKIHSHLGNFDGERIGADKGEPAWNKVQFAAGEQVIVTIPDGAQCNAVIDKPTRDYTGLVTYYVYFTCPGESRTSGSFPAHKIRRP